MAERGGSVVSEKGPSPIAKRLKENWTTFRTANSETPRTKSSGFTESEENLQAEVDNLKARRRRAGDGKFIVDIHESMQQLQGQLYTLQNYIVILVFLSLLLGIIVNEICTRDDYITKEPSPADVKKIQEQRGRSCNSQTGESIKIVLSGITVFLIFLVIRQWRLRVQMLERNKRIEEYYFMPGGTQLKRRTPLSMYVALVVEVGICAIHPFPYVHSDIEVPFLLDFPLFYRFESCMVGFMFLRLYLLWRWFKLVAFYRFLCLEDSFAMEDYSALDQMHLSANISANAFPLKVMVSKYPVVVIASTMLVIFFSVCYLVRITEGPAYQPHSDDWWDQMWIAITQGTTGYGGTTPVTQWGRFCACLMMLIGPMAVSFMTATTSKSITLTDEEHSLLKHMEANTRKIKVLTTAAELLQFWWRERLSTNPQFQERKRWFPSFNLSRTPSVASRDAANAAALQHPDEPTTPSRRHSENPRMRSVRPSDDDDDPFRLRHAESAPAIRGRRRSSVASVESSEAMALHKYSGRIRALAVNARKKSALRMRHSSLAHTDSSVSSRSGASMSRTSSIDMPVAATNPIALRFVYMLGQPYRDAKKMLLMRNFYTALAAYDRFVVQHRKVVEPQADQELPFHRTPTVEDTSGRDAEGLDVLRRDVEMLQVQMNDVLDSLDGVKRIEKMLALLIPAEEVARIQKETPAHRPSIRSSPAPSPTNAGAHQDGAGVGSEPGRSARRYLKEVDEAEVGGVSEVKSGQRKTVSFREQKTRPVADVVQEAAAQRKGGKRHSMTAVQEGSSFKVQVDPVTQEQRSPSSIPAVASTEAVVHHRSVEFASSGHHDGAGSANGNGVRIESELGFAGVVKPGESALPWTSLRDV